MKGYRVSMIMLLNYAKLITVTNTLPIPARSAQVQNPIDQQYDRHHRFIPAVSSLGASPTSAQ
jgi:hypothetical protein